VQAIRRAGDVRHERHGDVNFIVTIIVITMTIIIMTIIITIIVTVNITHLCVVILVLSRSLQLGSLALAERIMEGVRMSSWPVLPQYHEALIHAFAVNQRMDRALSCA
jgi:hypothetical protein